MQRHMQPLFILSLPRAGSTWIQRLLASHSDIATVSEPWILLPYLYSLRSEGAAAEYDHQTLVQAVEDFCQHMPDGRNTYLREIRRTILNLYAAVAPDSTRYFLDKTPRYHLIAEDLFELFPDAKFIFLWRNPLAIAASIISTWGNGKWNIFRYHIDLYKGLANLTATYKAHERRSISVRYEDLVANPKTELNRLCGYLGLDYHDAMLRDAETQYLAGRMGDKTSAPALESQDRQIAKWKEVFRSPIRKAWAHRYLEWIGRERLQIMGYDPNELHQTLQAVPLDLKFLASDLGRLTYGIGCNYFQGPMLKQSLVSVIKGRRSYALR